MVDVWKWHRKAKRVNRTWSDKAAEAFCEASEHAGVANLSSMTTKLGNLPHSQQMKVVGGGDACARERGETEGAQLPSTSC